MTPKIKKTLAQKKPWNSRRHVTSSYDKINEVSLVLGVVGPSGAGKSTVCAHLKERGFLVVDVDLLAKELYLPGEKAYAWLKNFFGPSVLKEDGTIDRVWLGKKVFSNPEDLKRLDEVIFPLLLKKLQKVIEKLKKQDVKKIALDMAILFEAKAEYLVDFVLVVQAPVEVRVKRLIKNRGLSREAAQRQANALVLKAKDLLKGNFFLWNKGELSRLRASLDSYLESLLKENV